MARVFFLHPGEWPLTDASDYADGSHLASGWYRQNGDEAPIGPFDSREAAESEEPTAWMLGCAPPCPSCDSIGPRHADDCDVCRTCESRRARVMGRNDIACIDCAGLRESLASDPLRVLARIAAVAGSRKKVISIRANGALEIATACEIDGAIPASAAVGCRWVNPSASGSAIVPALGASAALADAPADPILAGLNARYLADAVAMLDPSATRVRIELPAMQAATEEERKKNPAIPRAQVMGPLTVAAADGVGVRSIVMPLRLTAAPA